MTGMPKFEVMDPEDDHTHTDDDTTTPTHGDNTTTSDDDVSGQSSLRSWSLMSVVSVISVAIVLH